MVVGLTGRRAVHAGLEVLKQGGSASTPRWPPR